MACRERQRRATILLLQDFLKDPGNGLFLGKEREFVLRDSALNIWEAVGEEAIHYFERNNTIKSFRYLTM